MTLDEWESGYLEACGTAVREAIQGAVDAFPEVAERLSAQGCMCTMALDDGLVDVSLDTDFRWLPKTAEEAEFLRKLQDNLYCLGTTNLFNAMAGVDRDAYEGCYVEWPLIKD